MAKQKKIVKPTLAEAKIINTRLQKMYPQMYQRPAGEIQMLRGMSATDRKKTVRMVDKKLKHIRDSQKPRELKKKYKGKKEETKMTKQSEREETQLERLKKNIKMILKGPKYETPTTKRHKAGQVGSERVRKQAAKEVAIKAAGAAQFDREMKKATKKPVSVKKAKPKKKKPIKLDSIDVKLRRAGLTQEEILKLRGTKR